MKKEKKAVKNDIICKSSKFLHQNLNPEGIVTVMLLDFNAFLASLGLVPTMAPLREQSLRDPSVHI